MAGEGGSFEFTPGFREPPPVTGTKPQLFSDYSKANYSDKATSWKETACFFKR